MSEADKNKEEITPIAEDDAPAAADSATVEPAKISSAKTGNFQSGKDRGKAGLSGMSNKKGGKRRPPRDGKDDDGFEQKIVDLARVTRVMKGGKRMRFRACVAIGNKNGKVGIGIAKAADVTNAITKAVEQAKKKIVSVQIINGTIAHDTAHKFGAAKIMMKVAPAGRGIIAGGAMRIVLELAGIRNIVGKIKGSKNKVNIVKCVVEALSNIKQVDLPASEKAKKNNKMADKLKDKKTESEQTEVKAKSK